MDTSAFLHHLAAQPGYSGQMVHVEHIPRRQAKSVRLHRPLADALQECLTQHGLFPFYSHQAEAISCAREGRNVMVATSSASGKTLCYNAPVMEAILTEPRSCALYLFPTKALAQDQLRSLNELFYPALFQAGEVTTFDGDTPQVERADIRKRARVVLTNPDMLHLGILPNHQQWSRLLRRLKYVVIDEDC